MDTDNEKEDILPTKKLSLAVPGSGEVTFELVSSLPAESSWEDVEGAMYALGGQLTEDSTEQALPNNATAVIQPVESGLFAVLRTEEEYELYYRQPDSG